MRNEDWIRYEDRKPEIGQLVLCIRDLIEELQYCAVKWTEEEERWADMNDIVYWMPIYKPYALIGGRS